MDLNNLMTIDHVVYVREDGTVTDDREITYGVYAPVAYCEYAGPFAEAQISREHTAALVAELKAQGWDPACGWSAQYLTQGTDPVMHVSEYIGGALANHIRETPGFWVAVSVELHPRESDPEYRDGNGESDTAGWIVAHRESR